MSHTLTPCVELPLTGNTITLPFPDMARPVPGGWTFTVNLKTSDPSPGDTTIRVMQGATTISSTVIHPTNSPQDFTVTISNDDINKATKGLCNISGLTVVITEIPSACCPDADIPDTLHISVSTREGCDNCSAEGFTTMTRSGNIWIGSANNCGRTWEIRLHCEAGTWILISYCSGIQANSPYMAALGSTCIPFEMHFPAVMFGPTNNICNCLDEHGNPKGALLDFVITA